MKVVILRSTDHDDSPTRAEDYLQEFDTLYAERVIRNLRDDPGYCSACGPDCSNCRRAQAKSHTEDIAAVIDFPALLPYLLETPADYLPRDVPAHDVLLAIHIHEQILLEVVKCCAKWGTKAVVVPLEAPDWVSGAAKAAAYETCEAQGIDLAFPKPFCSFNPPVGGVLSDFRERFAIGAPDVELAIDQGRIRDARVKVSAACGATYCVGRWLVGRDVNDNLEVEVISKRLHSFPCTASMVWDYEIGDTVMHAAAHAHYDILSPIRESASANADDIMIMSPLGRMVQKPAPARENLENVERAKQFILAELARRTKITFEQLRENRKISPAAINSALIILKKEEEIRTEGTNIVRSV